MTRRTLPCTLVLALLLAAPPAARADAGMEDAEAVQPASVLALQALVLLEQGRDHALAEEKLDRALDAEDAGNVSMEALRAAHRALHEDAAERARELLQGAFIGGHEHRAGAVYRPAVGSSQTVAASVGVVVLALAAFALLRSRSRPSGASPAR